MIQSVMWGSDSCGCTFIEDYESDNPESRRVIREVIFACEYHSQLGSPQEILDTVHRENSIKNILYGHLMESNVLPLSAIDTTSSYDEDTRTVTRSNILHNNINYKFYFTTGDGDSRKIVFSLEGIDKNGNVFTLDNNQKSSIKYVLDSKMGNGTYIQKDLITVNTDEEYKKSLELIEKGKREFMNKHAELEKKREDMSRLRELGKRIFKL